MLAWVRDHGWYVKAAAGTCIMIPTGCMVVKAPQPSCFGYKWAVSSDNNDRLRVTNQLQLLLNDFPELRGQHAGYHQFYDYLLQTSSA